MLPSRPCDFRNDCHSWLVYWLPWSEWTSTCFLAITPPYSHQQCVQDNVLCHPGLHWPADNFVWEQINNHGKIQPAFVGPDVGYVRYPTLIRSIRIELSLEPVGRHDTGLAFTCPRAPVSDLSLYPDTFHQSPDSVHSALLPAVPQIQMDFAITIDASRLQPELFNLSCQSQVCLMALWMRLLKPGVKTTGMNIQHPTEQANRPATGVVTDKGVPQSDSFAKYAAAFFICPVRR